MERHIDCLGEVRRGCEEMDQGECVCVCACVCVCMCVGREWGGGLVGESW